MAGEIIRPKYLPPKSDINPNARIAADDETRVWGPTIAEAVGQARPFATQAQAEAGTSTTATMNPLTTKQAIEALVPSKIATAINELALGSASQANTADFATAAQGAAADSAVQPADLATVATTGAYGDLSGKPILGTAAAENVGAFATAAQGGKADTALQSVVAGANVSIDSTDPRNPVISASGGGGGGAMGCGGRLTLTSGVPVTDSDVTGATSIHYTPAVGHWVPIYNGLGLEPVPFAETTMALDATVGHVGYHQSAKAFDVFAFIDGAIFRIGTGPAWVSDASRGTGVGTAELEQFQGFLVNKHSITLRFGANSGDTLSIPSRRATYLGTFYATANGQATDSKRRRLLFNAANRALRPLRAADPAASWTYSLTTWRQANANANNQVEVMLGLAGISVALILSAFANNSTTSNRNIRVAIGLDSTTARAPDCPGAVTGVTSAAALQVGTNYFGAPGIGRHALTWLEMGGGTDTQTWFANDVSNGNYEAGLSGQIAI